MERAKLNVQNERLNEDMNDGKAKKFKCNVCGYESSNRGHLITHTRVHTGERPFKCTVTHCGMTFKQESFLSNHIKCKHSDERQFKCDFPGCLHTAKTHANLFTHKRVHNVERQFACTKCSYKAAFYGSLKRHMHRHSTTKDLKCNYPSCTKSFKSSSGLRSHIRNQHGEQKFHCDHPGCGQKFAKGKGLNAHKMLVHAEKTHVCPNGECSYSSNKLSNLARHMIAHKGKNEKIPCSVEGCEYKGKNITAMQNHKRRHGTLLPCPVSRCGRYAPTKEALQNHLKLHSPSGRPFQCPLCFNHFQKLHHLQDHCVIHTNEKPFKCGHCEHAAARQVDVKTHIASVHAKIHFPFIVHLPGDHECLHCKVILSSAEFLVHAKEHEGAVAMT